MNLSAFGKGEISPFGLDTRTTETKIDDLLVQIRNLDGFISAARELRCIIVNTFSESEYHPSEVKIIEALETARSTLQAAGIGLFEWVECPPRRQCHKAAYLETLRALHARKGSVSPELKRRLNILLMPLTSNFKFVQSRGAGESDLRSYVHDPVDDRQSRSEELDLSTLGLETPALGMPPPDTSRVRGTHSATSRMHRSRSTHRILWLPDDLEHNRTSRRRRSSRSESPAGRRGSGMASGSNENSNVDQENQPPPSEPQVYRPPRAFGKFGIYCTGKSSMHRKSAHSSSFSDRPLRGPSVRAT